jgi:DNA polymerase I-like protein with 3'-5' exonuclease and polymerase domains
MLQSQPFLYSGREWIDRYYGEDQEDNVDFQEVLEMANEAKNKMIQGVLKYMESEGIEIDLDKVNRLIKKFASMILKLYISFA